MGNKFLEKLTLRALKDSPYRIEPVHLNNRESIGKIQPSSLLNWYGNIYSQRGQDGILAEIFRRLRIEKGFFVEFGAWDGLHLSNSRFLFEKGWSGCYIEGDGQRFQTLQKNYSAYADIHLVNAFVQTNGDSSLDALLKKEKIERVDLLSIDIDGYDLEIFRSLAGSGIKPKVIVIEGGSNFSPYLQTEIPADIANQNIQQPLSVIIKSGKAMGYQPVCFLQDCYFVLDEYFHLFDQVKNDSVSLYMDSWHFGGDEFRKSIISNHLNKGLAAFEKDLEKTRQLTHFEQ